jgi:hypothetical protein
MNNRKRWEETLWKEDQWIFKLKMMEWKQIKDDKI